MKQLLILSGKGGTGKTTVSSAFIKLSHVTAYADCDVDAPNLHLIMHQRVQADKTDYYGLPKAEINKDVCKACGRCIRSCRFDAINPDFHIDPFACEGCGVCAAVCPFNAISFIPEKSGDLMLYKDDNTVFSTAQLKMGSGTSGMLVTEVKRRMTENISKDVDLTVIDGSPGIGCPVIASISGVDLVLIVTEPTVSGISDMERIIQTARKFKTRIAVCVNKYDTNINNTEKIEEYCNLQELPFAGRIPFDPMAVTAVNSGKSIADIECISGKAVSEVYQKVLSLLI